jgi:hypothetical protein
MLDAILLIIPLITVAASLIVIVPILIGIMTIKNWLKTPLNIVFYYCLIYSIFELVAWYYVLNHRQNHFLANSVIYLDLIFWGFYFYKITLNHITKKMIILIIGLSICIALWSHLGTGRDFNRIDSFANSISNISLIAIVLLFFYQLLNNLDTKDLLSYSHFWISVGVLIYFSGVFFVHIFSEYITFSKNESLISFWITKDYLLFFQRIFLAIGLWFSKTPPQLSPSSK